MSLDDRLTFQRHLSVGYFFFNWLTRSIRTLSTTRGSQFQILNLPVTPTCPSTSNTTFYLNTPTFIQFIVPVLTNITLTGSTSSRFLKESYTHTINRTLQLNVLYYTLSLSCSQVQISSNYILSLSLYLFHFYLLPVLDTHILATSLSLISFISSFTSIGNSLTLSISFSSIFYQYWIPSIYPSLPFSHSPFSYQYWMPEG